jgi:predicted dehydrogenase
MRVRFAAIGLNHPHIYRQVELLQQKGAELAGFFAAEADLCAQFSQKFPGVKQARSADELLDNPSIQLITGAGIPCDRAAVGIRAMRAGKDVLMDKPGFTTLEQLAEVRRVQAETKRIYSVFYGRLDSPSTFKAGELVKAGAIGRVIQVLGLGPHRANLPQRPPWFVKKSQYGGILCDIASHEFDAFLFFTGSHSAEIVASQVANYTHPEHPELEDFGDVVLRSATASAYIRVDWFTPKGLNTFGDCRLVLLGTDGFIELRQTVDLAGRDGGEHLFICDHKDTRHMDCRDVEVPFGKQLVDDVQNRTETAQSQALCFMAAELSLRAEAQAQRLGHLK